MVGTVGNPVVLGPKSLTVEQRSDWLMFAELNFSLGFIRFDEPGPVQNHTSSARCPFH